MIYNDLALFIAVARAGSFSGAASELGLTLSKVSRRIADLEQNLGFKLFERTTRHMRLTEEGRILLDRAQAPIEALQDISGTGASLKQQVIRMTAPSLAARRTVAPRLLAFMRDHPDTRIDLNTSNIMLDFARDNIDIALRLGPLGDSNLVAKKLWDVPCSFCASERFLEAHNVCETMDKETLLSLPAIESRLGWRLEGGKKLAPTNIRHSLDDLELIQRVATNDFGIALLPDTMLAPPLVPLYVNGCIPELRTMYVVYPERRLLPQRIRTLIEYLSTTP